MSDAAKRKKKPSPKRTVRRWCVWSPTKGYAPGVDRQVPWVCHKRLTAMQEARGLSREFYRNVTDWQPRRCTVTVEVEKGGKKHVR